MHMQNSHKHENAKDSKAALGIHIILDKGEKGGWRDIKFQKWEWEFYR